jgi:hypothetical protein
MAATAARENVLRIVAFRCGDGVASSDAHDHTFAAPTSAPVKTLSVLPDLCQRKLPTICHRLDGGWTARFTTR